MCQPNFAPERKCTHTGKKGNNNYILGARLTLHFGYATATDWSQHHPMARREKKGSAEVNNLDRRSLLLRAHYVLRLDVQVDNVTVVQVLHLVKIRI